MKKICILSMALLLCIGLVSASDPTGFNLLKNVVVKGDWGWEGNQQTGSWKLTYPSTASYNYQVTSPLATQSSISNYDNLGTPWKYIGESGISINKPALFNNTLLAWTVNDPATTQATGGYTKYNFRELTQITCPDAESHVSLSANGFGYLNINSVVVTDSDSIQFTHIGINE